MSSAAYPPGHCYWKDMQLLNYLNVISSRADSITKETPFVFILLLWRNTVGNLKQRAKTVAHLAELRGVNGAVQKCPHPLNFSTFYHAMTEKD